MDNLIVIINKIIGNNLSLIKIVEDEIKYINTTSPNKWALSLKSTEGIRIHFAGLIVFTISKDNIWLSVNPENFSIVDENIWQWENKEFKNYVKYKNIEIRNGYLKSFEYSNWNIIKNKHFDVINKITKNDYVLDVRTIKNHDNDILFLLNEKYKIDLPYPDFSLKKEYSDFFEKSNEIKAIFEYLDKKIDKTEKQSIINTRIGQNIFRKKLLLKYNKCAICNLQNQLLLRASHIKSWAASNNDERLDVANGLLLCSNHDSLFDSGLISFSDNGNILISSSLSINDLEILKLKNIKLTIMEESAKYLIWHRENVFNKLPQNLT